MSASSVIQAAGSAPQSASPQPGETPAWTTRIARAAYAAALFALTVTQKRKPVRLLAQRDQSRSLVYNIEVADAHCYYAAGLLVSNCEATQYGAMEYTGVMEEDIQNEQPQPEWMQKLMLGSAEPWRITGSRIIH